jgi:hypothetical protein
MFELFMVVFPMGGAVVKGTAIQGVAGPKVQLLEFADQGGKLRRSRQERETASAIDPLYS